MKKMAMFPVDFPRNTYPQPLEVTIPAEGRLRFVEFQSYVQDEDRDSLYFHMEVEEFAGPDDEMTFLVLGNNVAFDDELYWYWMSFKTEGKLFHIYEKIVVAA